MITHEELFKALLDREELINEFNGKILKLDDAGNAVLISKNWHNFNPSEWKLNKPEDKTGAQTENKN